MKIKALGANYYQLMERCVELSVNAPEGISQPHVGALVWYDGKIVGEGWKEFLEPTHFTRHAERMAIENAYGLYDPERSLLITTLEPCVPKKGKGGKKGLLKSCSELIIESGIKKVIVGQKDRTSVVYDSLGIRYLKERGVEIITSKYFHRMVCSSEIANYNPGNGA